MALSSAEAPSVGKQRGKRGKRERYEEIKSPAPARAAPARFNSPLPIPHPTGKTKETCGGERHHGTSIKGTPLGQGEVSPHCNACLIDVVNNEPSKQKCLFS